MNRIPLVLLCVLAVGTPTASGGIEPDRTSVPTTGAQSDDVHPMWVLPGGVGPGIMAVDPLDDNGFPDAIEAEIQDTIVQAKPRLLPENMSFMERGLWGEDGLMRSIGLASPLTPEARKHELAIRRTMLGMHQIGGFATLASMIATVYFGQKYLDTGERSARNMHGTLIPITIGLYSATALLSVLSPPPMIRRDEMSTTWIHKTLAWVHVAGMILTPILGAMINRRGASYYEQARVHQVSAYVTTAVFTASMVVITL